MRGPVEEQSGVREAIRRRRHLLPLGVVLTALLCLLASMLVPTTYKVTARVLVFPYYGVDDTAANPYLSLNGLDPAASVLAEAVSSAESRRVLRASGATGTFTVAPDATVQGPVLLVDVRDRTARGAMKSLPLVVTALTRTLNQLQSQLHVPARQRLGSTVVSRDSTVVAVHKKQVRAVLVAGVAGVAGTLLVISMLDAFLLRRRSRGDERRGQVERMEPRAPVRSPWRLSERM